MKKYSRLLKASIPHVVFLIIFNLFLLLIFHREIPSILLIILWLTLNFSYTLLALYLRRRRDLIKINSTVKRIINNEFDSSEQIELGEGLYEIEASIKEMFVKIKKDISNLKKLEKIRTQFLGNVSHELRTPIFSIQGYIETLSAGAINDPNVNKKFLDKAQHYTHNLSNLLNDLIDISMIESGEMKMNYSYTGINVYLKKIADDFIPEAKSKGIELIFNQVDGDVKYFIDQDKLKQVIVNLLSNAIRYTETGKVEISVEDYNRYGKIIVSDTGIGISSKDKERIFERFYRVDKARSRAVGGTGLGLAIVKHIVEAHGSHVLVKSKLGKGSSFSFKLKK